MPGTTRDLVTETADIDGLRLELIDTAGIRDAADEVEIEGVARARQAWTTADLVLVVLDAPSRSTTAIAICFATPQTLAARRCEQIRSASAWTGAELNVPIELRFVEDRRRSGWAAREIACARSKARMPHTARHGARDERASRRRCSSERATRCGAHANLSSRPAGRCRRNSC